MQTFKLPIVSSSLSLIGPADTCLVKVIWEDRRFLVEQLEGSGQSPTGQTFNSQ